MADQPAKPEKPEEQPKLVVDEDWKAQAQAEKEALEREVQAKQQAASSTQDAKPHNPSATAAETEEPVESAEPRNLPPPSFAMLISSLAAQAMAVMGGAMDAEGKRVPPQKDVARHIIDTLAMLEQKTAGNLDEQEQAMLTGILHELRMAFLTLK